MASPAIMLTSLPPTTRACLFVVLCLTLCFNMLRYRNWALGSGSSESQLDYLVMVPARSYLKIWTYVTSGLVDSNIWTALVSLATIFYGGRYLERAWSSREYFKFFAITTIVPTVCVFVLYMISSEPIFGTVALQSGFVVAFKQLGPEYTLSIFRIFDIKVKRLPLVFLALNIFYIVFTHSCVGLWLCVSGLYVSWAYLRFYKATVPDLATGAGLGASGAALHGDPSEAFSFASFFPERFHNTIDRYLSTPAYNLAVRIHAVPLNPMFAGSSMGGGSTMRGASLDGVDIARHGGHNIPRQEAERRRALALKALDERLNAASAQRAPSIGSASGSTSTKMNPITEVTSGAQLNAKTESNSERGDTTLQKDISRNDGPDN